MSLRFRLFILFGGLLVVLLGAELLLVRSLTEHLSVQVGELATTVGRRVVRFVGKGAGLSPAKPGGPTANFVFHAQFDGDGDVPSPEALAKALAAHTRAAAARDGQAVPDASETQIHVETRVADDAGKTNAPHFRFLHVHGPTMDTSIPIPEGGVGRTLAAFQKHLLLGSLGILGLGLLVAAFVADRVSSPLRDLAQAARRVGEGGLGVTVARRAGGEAGTAIESFNRMSLRLAELEREASLLKERQHLGELGDVARGLAHALRNPLNAIGLSVDELATRASGEGSDELADSARRQIRRVDESIRSFLALAAFGSGTSESLDAGALVEDVVLSALQDARGRVRIEVSRPEARTELRGIAAELRAVVQALVVNAVEATPDGGVVRVRLAPGDERVVVEVEDDGPGLAPEVREHLFQPHVTTKSNGSGMGLFLAQRIASSRYRGDVQLSGRAQGGVLARLTLRDREETAVA